MDSRRAAMVMLLLLLLLSGWGHSEGPRDWDGNELFVEEDSGARAVQDTHSTGSLLRSLLEAMERQGRSPAFQFQPQRFGRNTGGPWNNQRLRPRGGQGPGSQFWSLATPQRFGKK
ncbi:pro-FMRFamide-related neuropeptide FF [Ochotona princeps]|uniref:pro-FMRFamide-related neuropeptide FF n=1 Tax=Ochotona princeps TaxID=9978 RepID=UPI00064B97A8|nr:pro-FMRFamide-related neuropeptide FF [Ochotona princeps]